jgi:CBS domain-containing protein
MTETWSIRYRVVDFLKQYPPFQAMAEDDLLGLTAHGRVRFHEADEYLYWQGQRGPFFLVIQRGTVSLWEDSGSGERLRDVRGPGDLLAIDSLLGSETYLHSAKANGDVILYALTTADFRPLLDKYPSAARYVAAHASVRATDTTSDSRRGAHETFVYEALRHEPPATCSPEDTVRTVARELSARGAPALAAVDAEGRLLGVLTRTRVLEWIGRDRADVEAPASRLLERSVPTVTPEATVGECLLAAAQHHAEAVAVTEGGAPGGRLHALATQASLASAFGEQPLELLGEIEHATSHEALRALNQRARTLLLEQATSPSAVDWLTRLAMLVDTSIVGRVLALAGLRWEDDGRGHDMAWFLFGSCGRGESVTPRLPQIGLIFGAAEPSEPFVDRLRRAADGLTACGYLPRQPLSEADARFRCASFDEWERRFREWVRDPVGTQLYRARPMFDLRTIFGDACLVERLQSLVLAEVAASPSFLRVLAHDCLGNLPPLSFFRDLVVEETGEQDDVFHLERSALRPLVDVGRVFGLASGRVFGASTLERLLAARAKFSDHEAVFRDAADTLRVLLLHQIRSGLRRHDEGTQIPPSSLGHYERRVLKTGFRSILRILEFTGECRWLSVP